MGALAGELVSGRAMIRLAKLAGRAAGLGRSSGAAMVAGLLAAAATSAVIAGPEGQQVVVGNVTFTKQGNMWVITASNGAIINYASFDVLPYETIRFMQPSQLSTVLNRINSAAPTRIDGTIQSNGIVYFVNPAGVVFGRGATINTGGLYAAAGNISNQDFLAGRNHFTDVSGQVVNQGTITSNMVAMVGQQISNSGTIVSPEGTVVMAAGKDVFIGRDGSQVYTQVTGPTQNTKDRAAIENTGTINARGGNVLMAAGDASGLAIFNSGTVRAKNINIEGRGEGEVRISGTIDASNNNGTGGNVTITGEKVGLFGADINASGSTGGGTIKVGGGERGGDISRQADYVFVDSHTTLNADATVLGNGGRITFYSTHATRVGGQIFARGGQAGGNGGFVETSGGWIDIGTAPIVSARGVLGQDGVWLIDPRNIRIVAGNSSTDFGDSNSPFDDPNVDDAQLGVDVITAALATGNVIIDTGVGGAQAGNITFETNLSYTGGSARSLTLNAASGITFSAGVTVDSTNAALSLVLNANGVVALDTAAFTLNGGDFTVGSGATNVSSLAGGTINTNGGAVTFNNTGTTNLAGTVDTNGGNLTLGGTNVTISGAVTTNNGTISIVNSGTTSIGSTVDSGNGTIGITSGGAINTTTTGDLLGGAITISSTGNVTIGGQINSNGNLSITADSDNNGAGSLTFGAGVAVGVVCSGTVFLAASVGSAGGTLISFNNQTLFSGGTGVSILGGAGSIVMSDTVDFNTMPVTMSAAEMNFDAAVSGTGSLTLLSGSSSRAITLGGSDAANRLDLTATDIGNLANGFSSITIGSGSLTGQITVASNVSFLDDLTLSTAGASQINLNGDLASTGTVTLNSKVVLGATAIVTGSTVTFANTVNGAFGLTVTGNAVFNAAVGGSAALSSLSVSGTTSVGTTGITTTGTQTYTGAVTLSANTIFTGSTITFDSTLDGAQTSAIIGNAVFNGVVGGSTALTGLAVSGTTTINTSGITTSGVQGYTGAVTLSANSTLTGSTITFNSTLNGAQTLSVAGNGIFNGIVGGSTALTSLAVSGTSTINTTGITTSGTQGYTGAVTLSSNTTLTGSTVTFSSTVNGARTLTITGDGVFDGIVGGTTALTSLSVSGTSALNANVTTSGTQTYTGASTVGANITLTGSGITFSSTLDTDGTARTLSIVDGGNTTLSGAVGAVNAFSSISITGAGTTINLGNDIAALNGLTFGKAVVLTGNSTISATTIAFQGTLNGAFDAVVQGTGAVTFAGVVGGTAALNSLNVTGTTITLNNNVTTVGDQTYNSPTLLGGNITLTSTGGAVNFVSTLNSTGAVRSLVVDANTTATFGGIVGGTSALLSLTTTGATAINGGAITTTAGQTFGGATTIGAATTLTSGTTVTFSSTVDGAFNLDISANAVFNGIVGGSSALNALAVSGNTTINTTAITTTTTQTYFNAVTLSSNTTLTGSSVNFVTTVDGAQALTITGDATFGDVVGGTTALTSLSVSGTTLVNGTNITTTGAQTYTGAVTLGANAIFSGVGITFSSTIDGDSANARSLSVVDSGTTTFGGAIGSNFSLTDVTTDTPGSVVAGAITATGDVLLGGTGGITLGGNISSDTATFNGPVTLSANVTIAANTVSFTSTIDAQSDGGAGLTINSNGTTTFGGDIGATFALSTLTTDNNGSTLLNGSQVRTTGMQSYGDAVTIGSTNFVIIAGDLDFADNVTGSGVDLTITTFNNTTNIELGGPGSGGLHLTALELGRLQDGFAAIRFGDTGHQGQIQVLADPQFLDDAFFDVDGANGGLIVIDSNISSNSVLSFNGPVNITSNATIASTGTGSAGDISFNGTVNSTTSSSLTVNTAGTTTFGGVVGGTNALSSLTTDTGGTTAIAADITTTGTQTYNDDIRLDGSTVLTGNGISILGNVDVAADDSQDLTITDAGTTVFGATTTLGTSIRRLRNFTVNGAGTFTLGIDITTTRNQTYTSNVIVSGNRTLTTGDTNLATTGAVTFGGTVDGATGAADSLTVTANSVTTFGGAVGAGTGINSITVNGTGATTINANVTTIAGQSYTDTTTANGITLTSGAGIATDDLIALGDLTLSAVNGITVGGVGTFGGLLTATAGDDFSVVGNTNFNGAGASSITANDISFGGTLDSAAGANLTLTANTNGADLGAISVTGATNLLGTFTATASDSISFAAALTAADLVSMTAVNDVTITGAATLNGVGANSITGNDVTFASTLTTAAGANLTLTGNTSGADAGDVIVTGVASLGGNTTITATNDIRFLAATTTSAATLTATATRAAIFVGNVALGGTTAITGRNLVFGGTINGNGLSPNLTLNATGAGTNAAQPLMVFGGSIGGTTSLGTLIFSSPSGNPEDVNVGTVFFGTTLAETGSTGFFLPTATGGAFAVTADTVTFQSGHRIASLGDLTLTSNVGDVTVGDLAVLGNITINAAGNINLNLRGPTSGSGIQTANGQFEGDTGVDWVASGNITVNKNITGADSTFTLGAGGVISGGDLSSYASKTTSISAAAFTVGGGLRSFDLRSGQTTDVPPIAGLNPKIDINVVATPEPVDDELADLFKSLFGTDVEPSLLSKAGATDDAGRESFAALFTQLLDSLVGRSIYNDTGTAPAIGRTGGSGFDYRVSRQRLTREMVESIVDRYHSVFDRPDVDENGLQKLDAKGRGMWLNNYGVVRESVSRAWKKYASSAKTVDGQGFRVFLESSQDEECVSALEKLNAVKGIFDLLGQIGLSEFELRKPRQVVLSRLRPTGINELGGENGLGVLEDAVLGRNRNPAPGMLSIAK